MYYTFVFFILLPLATASEIENVLAEDVIIEELNTTESSTELIASSTISTETSLSPCICGVFLSSTIKKRSKEPPHEFPALSYELPETFPCTNVGKKMCTNKCLENIVKHLPNSPNILCGAIDRDCIKERASLFVKNCQDEWVNTNFAAGREYCCKDGLPFKCPS